MSETMRDRWGWKSMTNIVVAYIQFGHFGDNVVEHYDNIEGTLEDGPFILKKKKKKKKVLEVPCCTLR
jgi:hypothetical protein